MTSTPTPPTQAVTWEQVRASDLFSFFHMSESGRSRVGDVTTVQLESQGFTEFVDLKFDIDPAAEVVAFRLMLDRRWLDDTPNGIHFAADLVGSVARILASADSVLATMSDALWGNGMAWMQPTSETAEHAALKRVFTDPGGPAVVLTGRRTLEAANIHDGARTWFSVVWQSPTASESATAGSHSDFTKEARALVADLLDIADKTRGEDGGAKTAEVLYLSVIKHAPRLDPYSANWARISLGTMKADAGDRADAERYLADAMNTGDDMPAPIAALNLGLLRAEWKDYPGAVEAFSRAVDSGEPRIVPRASFRLAIVLEDMGQPAEAARAYQRAIDSGDEKLAPAAAWNLGLMLKESNPEAAAAAFQAAIDSGDSEHASKAAAQLASLRQRAGGSPASLSCSTAAEHAPLQEYLARSGHSIGIRSWLIESDRPFPGVAGARLEIWSGVQAVGLISYERVAAAYKSDGTIAALATVEAAPALHNDIYFCLFDHAGVHRNLGAMSPDRDFIDDATEALLPFLAAPRQEPRQPSLKTLHLRYNACSDRGLECEDNEDSVYAGPRLLAVADGTGAPNGGAMASRLVVATMARLDDEEPGRDLLASLEDALRDSNAAISTQVVANYDLTGMRSSVTAICFAGNRFGLAHLGNTRAYVLRGGSLTPLTSDDPRSLTGHPVEPTLSVREAAAGDRFLLCTPGLSDVVSEEAITEALSLPAVDESGNRLVELALRAGGPDNVTVIVADVVEMNDESH